jgi:Ca2+-binding RTX toxin-like protein
MPNPPNWTLNQVLTQMAGPTTAPNPKWTNSVITFGFPVVTTDLSFSSPSNEVNGFQTVGAAQKTAARLAIQLWDDLIVNSLSEKVLTTTNTSSDIDLANTTVDFGYAQTYFPTDGTVWFNSKFNGTGATLQINNLMAPTVGDHSFSTYVHEIGHAFGLDHMGDYAGANTSVPSSFQDSTALSIMSYYGPSWGDTIEGGFGLVQWADWIGADGKLYEPQTPMLNDVYVIQQMYGADLNTRTGNTTYGFNSSVSGTASAIYNFTQNLNPILCIYDASGVDTLDLSGWSTSSTISLVPGTFSSGNKMTNNISIAYNCLIENAVGGTGADHIYGNNAGNALNGGAGSDSLRGEAANDTIDGGMGVDAAIYYGNHTQYSLSGTASRFLINDKVVGRDGGDTVSNVEYLQFLDGLFTASSLLSGVAPLAHYANDLSYSKLASGPTHFIDLLNLEASYVDLMNAFGTNQLAMKSWFDANQSKEHRVTTFNGLEYVASHLDLIETLGNGASAQAIADAGAQQFIESGYSQGLSTTFNGLDYIDSFPDLIKAFGTNSDAGAMHFIQYGHNEGRSVIFDGIEYIASYGDLIRAFGMNEQAGAAHYATWGFNEHRSTSSFNAAHYLAKYTDLQTAFGSDLHAATIHYINYGYNEGRSDL